MGTYHEEIDGVYVLIPVLNSDVGEGEYPYYLKSCVQISEEAEKNYNKQSIEEIYGKDWINENSEDFDKRIRRNEEISEMLLISRSTYYRYMNKAILIFGVMLFGYSIFDRFYEEQLNEKLKVAEDKIDYKIEL